MENRDQQVNNQGAAASPSPQINMGNAHTQKTQIGPIIGVVIIIIIIIFGGLYFIGKKVNDEGLLSPTAEEILGNKDSTLEMLQTQGASDEVGVIESDLDATILEDLDTELGNIDTELNF